MKKYPHTAFLEVNKIDPKTLPKMLQKRLLGFDELLEDLQHLVDDDRTQLEEQIDTLSLELEEDLLELYEDQLENNEIVEEEEKKEKVEPVKPAPKPAPVKKENPDETILEKLFSMKRTENLGRSTLRELGVKTPITSSEIRIGKFLLRRTSYFTYKYRLEKIG